MNEKQCIDSIVSNIGKVLLGKQTEILHILKGIIAGGHILIEDVPGVGKTTLVKALAKSTNLNYSRIQFTPDLLPSDITGISIYNQHSGNFEFKKGPVFTHILLADEINRTPPKTQSALLEVMEEYQVSEGNHTYFLEQPFIVLATQNPFESEGTYVLPESQLDRFIMKVKIGYVDRQTESDILQLNMAVNPLQSIQSVVTSEQILALQQKSRTIYASKAITNYIAAIIDSTRSNKYISLGASTRASISLLKIAQATALIDGRGYIIPDYVKHNVLPVLAHRILLSPVARAENLTCEQVLSKIVETIQIPRANYHDTL